MICTAQQMLLRW